MRIYFELNSELLFHIITYIVFMKKLLFILFLIPLVCIGQTEKPESKIVVDSFIKTYNASNYRSIFLMFSSKMKKALPLNELTEFLENLNSGAGIINNNEFIRYDDDNVAIYKTTLEKWTSKLTFSIDDNQKINGLFFNEFIQEDFSKNVINNLYLKDNQLSKDQIDLIFENSKVFPNNTELSFAFINNGEVSYYGVRRHNDSISTINNYQSIFEIGSISKVFTSNILANFTVNNKLKLDDNINDYLNLKFKNDIKISFNSLANHTSGLPRMPSNFSSEKLDSVSTVKVRHILISYNGSLESSPDVTISKNAAKKTADSILKILHKNKTEFNKLVSLSSDKEVSNEFGEIEFTYFDRFATEFRDFSFQNKVGSIDVIETVFGYHIIEILSKDENKRVVNVRDLDDNPYKYYDQSDLENYLENLLVMEDDLIGKHLYSNLGVGLLGHTLSQIDKISYKELFQKYIFSMYNMFSSTINIDMLNKVLVPGLDGQGKKVSNWDLSVLAPAGGIFSNVEDLSKYGIAQFDLSNNELNLIKQKTLTIDDSTDIGLGWFIINSSTSNNQWYWHNGATGGYSSSMAIDVKNKNGIIILSNVSAFNPFNDNIDQTCFDLMMTLINNEGESYY